MRYCHEGLPYPHKSGGRLRTASWRPCKDAVHGRFEARPQRHAHFVFLGNRDVADVLRRSRPIGAKIERATNVGASNKSRKGVRRGRRRAQRRTSKNFRRAGACGLPPAGAFLIIQCEGLEPFALWNL
jgi:hypothetical protein